MSSVQAWLLNLGPFRIALAYNEVLEVLVEPESWPLPIGPRWCREILAWRGRYVPLARLGLSGDAGFAVVAAISHPDSPGAIEYVALRLKQPPQLITVNSDDDCELPVQVPLPVNHIMACFKHDEDVVVVPDLAALFKVSDPRKESQASSQELAQAS